MKTFEDLEAVLRQWVSFADPHVYDAGGMAALFAACLDNMRARMLEVELEDIGSYLTAEQKAFLLKLATMLRRAPSPDQPDHATGREGIPG
jgi:hypothetical protein